MRVQKKVVRLPYIRLGVLSIMKDSFSIVLRTTIGMSCCSFHISRCSQNNYCYEMFLLHSIVLRTTIGMACSMKSFYGTLTMTIDLYLKKFSMISYRGANIKSVLKLQHAHVSLSRMRTDLTLSYVIIYFITIHSFIVIYSPLVIK